MQRLNRFQITIISGLFLFGVSVVSAEEKSVTVPYSIDGVNQDDVLEGKLKDNVIFKKGEKSKTITIKLKKSASKSSGKEPKFSLGDLPENLKVGENSSVTITFTDDEIEPSSSEKITKNEKQQIADQTVFVGDYLDLYILLEDSDGKGISYINGYSATGLPPSGSLNLDYYNIKGALSDKDVGEHTVTVSVKDNKGRNVSSMFKLTVKPKPATTTETKPRQIEFNIEKVEQAEGTAGEAEYIFTVRLVDGPVKEEVKARYSVTGSGTNPASANDFVGNAFPQGELTIPAGDQGAPITIKVKGDAVKEETEQFTITLSNPSSGVSIVDSGKSSIGVIQDGNGLASSSDSSFTDINECPACMNGGQCTDGRTCSCPPGFSGEICELATSTTQNTGTPAATPKKTFKLVEGSRKFLLMDSRLISGSSPTQVQSLTTSVTAITNPSASAVALTSSGAPLANADGDPFTNIEVRIDDVGTNTISAALYDAGGGPPSANGAFILAANPDGTTGVIGPSGGPFNAISPVGSFTEGSTDIIMQRITDSVFFKITISWANNHAGFAESSLTSLSGFNCGTSQANCP